MSSSRKKKTILRLLAMLRPQAWVILIATLLGFLAVASSISLLSLGAWIISMAALQPSIAVLQVAIVGVRFFGLARGICRYLERLVSHRVSLSILAEMRAFTYEKLERITPAAVNAYRSGDLLTRLSSDIETLQDFFVRVMSPPFVALGISVAGLTAASILAPEIVLILAAGYLSGGLLLPALMNALGRNTGREVIASRAELSSVWLDLIQGHAEILAFSATDYMQEKLNEGNERADQAIRRMGVIEGVEDGLALIIIQMTVIGALIMAIPRIEGVYLASIALGIAASFEAITPLPLAARYMESSREAARRLFEIADTELPVSSPVTPALPASNTLALNNLTFTYPGEMDPAISDISFTMAEGERVALIGASGAGKTTIANLLLGFWDVAPGMITLGGCDLRSIEDDEKRRRITAVLQDGTLFNMTLRENLKLANPESGDTLLIKALTEVGLVDFFNSLPQGLNTRLGEGGVRLSGGERQRILIAQALLKGGDIILLDEPTTHLDAANEAGILELLERITREKTTILITHRLIGLEKMDHIYVMQDGRLEEGGSHVHLMASGGLYHDMREALDSE